MCSCSASGPGDVGGCGAYASHFLEINMFQQLRQVEYTAQTFKQQIYVNPTINLIRCQVLSAMAKTNNITINISILVLFEIKQICHSDISICLKTEITPGQKKRT